MATNKEFELITGMYLSATGKAHIKIEPLRIEEDEDGCSELLEENGLLVFDKKDALKMLKAIEYINTYIL